MCVVGYVCVHIRFSPAMTSRCKNVYLSLLGSRSALASASITHSNEYLIWLNEYQMTEIFRTKVRRSSAKFMFYLITWDDVQARKFSLRVMSLIIVDDMVEWRRRWTVAYDWFINEIIADSFAWVCNCTSDKRKKFSVLSHDLHHPCYCLKLKRVKRVIVVKWWRKFPCLNWSDARSALIKMRHSEGFLRKVSPCIMQACVVISCLWRRVA